MKGESIIIASNKPNDLKTDCLKIKFETKHTNTPNAKRGFRKESQIRQILGDVSDSVIEQFERWWDKYAMSLSQIDSEIIESEAKC